MRHCLSLLLFIIATCAAYGQKIPVKGMVTDESGKPIPGVTITVKGTSQSVVTKGDGSFVIVLTSTNNVFLAASHTGYLSKEVKVNGTEPIKISLSLAEKLLDDVIVISALGL